MTIFPAIRRAALAFAGVAGLFAWSGCATVGLDNSVETGPFFTPANHVEDPVLPASVRRVVLLPLAGGEAAPAASLADLDPVVTAALQRQNRFEVVALSRDTCRRLFSVDELSSTSALPANFMEVIHQEYAADAVLFVDVTVFHAYRPLAIGLRAKLATVQGVRLLWSFDNLFSAADPATSNSARRFFRTSESGEIPADQSPAALQSPSRFTAYAAEAMFETLPGR